MKKLISILSALLIVVALSSVALADTAVPTSNFTNIDAFIFGGAKVRIDEQNNNANVGAKVRGFVDVTRNFDLGLVASVSGYEGEATNTYSGHDFGVGLSGRYRSDRFWDVTTDVMYVRGYSKSPGVEQDDDKIRAMAWYNIEQRRAVGEKYFPAVKGLVSSDFVIKSHKTNAAGRALPADEKASVKLDVYPAIFDGVVSKNIALTNSLVLRAGANGSGQALVGENGIGIREDIRYKGSDVFSLQVLITRKNEKNGPSDNFLVEASLDLASLTRKLLK